MTLLQRRKSGKSKTKGRGATHSSREWGHAIIWEFQVRAGMEKRFEKTYGSKGDWARLFAQDASHIATELIHHFNDGRRYITLDFWTSQKAFDEFKERNLIKYKALDRKCEDLTDSEREIGRGVRVLNK
jgi:heme-degrading monooxygenase HmoA